MTCSEAQEAIYELLDGRIVTQRRVDLDAHLGRCTACMEVMDESRLLRKRSGDWAAALVECADPGEAMNRRVLAAVANRHPGQMSAVRRSDQLTAAAVVLTSALMIGLGTVVQVPPSVVNGIGLPSTFTDVNAELRQVAQWMASLLAHDPPVSLDKPFSMVLLTTLALANALLYRMPLGRRMSAR